MADATCSTCPLWTRYVATTASGEPSTEPSPRGACHLASAETEDGETTRREDWWCSEHPLRQRDQLAAMAMQGWLASYSGEDLSIGREPKVAELAYRVADAMLAERAKGGGHG